MDDDYDYEITIDIRVGDIKKSVKLFFNLKTTIKEIIKKIISKYLNFNYIVDDLIMTVDNNICNIENSLLEYQIFIFQNKSFELRTKIYQKINHRENENKIIEKKPEKLKPIRLEKCKNNADIILSNMNIKKIEVEISIKFYITKLQNYNFINQCYVESSNELFGLLKLCLLKEISISSDFERIQFLPENLRIIMKILRDNKINEDILLENFLQKIEGGNIINFSRLIDEVVSQKEIEKYLISRLNSSAYKIKYIKYCLQNYIPFVRLFEAEFKRAENESVFEYSIASLVFIERNIYDFYNGYRECENVIKRILFHATSFKSISDILYGQFKRARNTQHGKGVYFTEDLESCWLYGSEDENHGEDKNGRNTKIPEIGKSFSFICTAIYYDENLFQRIYDYDNKEKRTPPKNGINFAYAEPENLGTINDLIPDPHKLFLTEYVIYDLKQICPFMGVKMKRDEYCIIWRDTNFSKDPIFNNEFDEIFKKFLKERMRYINNIAKYNAYPCETTEKALKLIKRKKYNKIILISNIGDDKGGKDFIIKARKIIGNNVIALFVSYNQEHLNWVKNFGNALYSNKPNFYEKYLDCFYNKNHFETCQAIINLKNNIENYYGVNFKFNNSFLDFPNFKNDGFLSELTF